MAKETGFPALMRLVAEQWCLSSQLDDHGEFADVRRFFRERGMVSADQFVDWVFRASWPGPLDQRPMWRRTRAEIRAAFITHLGAESVDVVALRWPGAQPEFLPLPDPEAFTRKLTEAELLDYREEFGADSREWILAQNELRRRRTRPSGSGCSAMRPCWPCWPPVVAAPERVLTANLDFLHCSMHMLPQRGAMQRDRA